MILKFFYKILLFLHKEDIETKFAEVFTITIRRGSMCPVRRAWQRAREGRANKSCNFRFFEKAVMFR